MLEVVQGLRGRLLEGLERLVERERDGVARLEGTPVVMLSRRDALLLVRVLEHVEHRQEWLEQLHGFVVATKSEPSKLPGL